MRRPWTSGGFAPYKKKLCFNDITLAQSFLRITVVCYYEDLEIYVNTLCGQSEESVNPAMAKKKG
jgi:hypothetical protein